MGQASIDGLQAKKNSYRINDNCLFLHQVYGAPDTIRTCDRLVRSQVLYPAELRALNLSIIQYNLNIINN